jgi:carbon storage regulator
MLVLSRKVHETIIINDKIRITVIRVSGNRVRLGVEAPETVNVYREELLGSGDAGREVAPDAPARNGATD